MKNPPMSGGGLHQWILDHSRAMILEGQAAETVHAKLYSLCEHKGREPKVLSGEIWDAIDGVIRWMDAEGVEVGASTRRSIDLYRSYREDPEMYDGLQSGIIDRRDNRPEYVTTNLDMQEEVIEACQDVKMKKYKYTAEKFDFNQLFDLDWNVCMCQKVELPIVRPISFWLEQEGWDSYQFTIPSGLIRCGEGGAVKNDANMQKRLYQVIEFDKVESLEDQFRLLWYLGFSKLTRLGMVVFSGHKSLHGWFPCFHLSARQIRSFILKATELGADPMLRIPSQYVRLPNGWNYKHNQRQEVLFWNQGIIDFHNEYVRKEML